MPIPSRPIPNPAAVEAESQEAIEFVLATIRRKLEHDCGHPVPGATVAQHPDLAIEALCILIGGTLAKTRELEARLAQWIGDGQPQ